jgi:hypothetical protein
MDLYVDINVSDEHAAFIFRAEHPDIYQHSDVQCQRLAPTEDQNRRPHIDHVRVEIDERFR